MPNTISHWGVISSIKSNDYTTVWYTTVSDNEVISFSRHINAITFWADTTPLYIEVSSLDGGQVIYVPAGENLSVNYLFINKIKVLGSSGQNLGYAAFYY